MDYGWITEARWTEIFSSPAKIWRYMSGIDPAAMDRWIELQYEMAGKLDLTDCCDVSAVTTIGAVDISFFPTDDRAISALVIMQGDKVVYEDYEVVSFDTPYISGFLGFREVPCYKKLLLKLKRDSPELYPEILLVDGNGILHHRLAGSATHLGIELDICTVGIAKNLLRIDGLCWKELKERVRKEVEDGPVPLIGDSGRHYGWAYCPPGGKKPIFISPGHKISVEGTLAVVRKFGPPYRIPLALRHADLTSRDRIRQAMAKEGAKSRLRVPLAIGILVAGILLRRWLSQR